MGRHKIAFTAEEKKVLKRAGFTGGVNSLSTDDLFEIDNLITDLLMDEGIEDDESVNALGRVCESIIGKLAEEA